MKNFQSSRRWFNHPASALSIRFGACGLTCVLASPATATPIQYGSFDGDTVFFENVVEEGNDGDQVLGTPVVNGDLLNFTPGSRFRASSFGDGTDEVTTRLATLLVADAGRVLDTLTASVVGDIDLLAINQSTESTRTMTRVVADTSFEVRVLAVDGAALATPVVLTGDGVLFEANLADDGTEPSRVDSTFTFDLASAASNAGIVGDITRLNWLVELNLFAQSEDGTQADVGFSGFSAIVLTAVPEPGSAALLFGAAGLLLRRRRAL